MFVYFGTIYHNNFRYFDKYDNGTYRVYNTSFDVTAYETTHIGNATMNWLYSDYVIDSPKPLMMWVGPHAPHWSATPAAWYANEFNTSYVPRTPNFNQNSSNKHEPLSINPVLNETAIEWVDQLYKDRLRSLLSIDDIIYELIQYLSKYNLLNNTYILYTSDHGYHLGQWRVPCGKFQMYETDIKVPMYIRGPNIPQQSVATQLVGNIDILPTFIDLANIIIPNSTIIDGKSMVGTIIPHYYNYNSHDNNSAKIDDKLMEMRRLLRSQNALSGRGVENSTNWRQVFLSQYRSIGTHYFSVCQIWWAGTSNDSNSASIVTQSVDVENNNFPGNALDPPAKNGDGIPWYIGIENKNNWRMLRILNDTHNWAYAEFITFNWTEESKENPIFYELYDVTNDYYQMNNLYPGYQQNNSMNGILQQLHTMLMTLGECQGSNCFE